MKQKAVLVVGAGGLGCPALSYLAAAGVGTIGICDDDQVEISNLHRQVLFTPGDAGRPKVNVAVERLAAQNPFIRLIAHPDRMTAANVEACVKDYDVVLDCTDNFASKFMLHDACFLAGVPLVQAAIYQFEGQLQVFRPRADAGCLRCLWPTEPAEGCVGTCADVGVIGVVPGVIGAMQACEAIKVLLDLPGVADRETVLMDLASIRMNRIQRLKNADCPLCGATPKIHSIDPEPEVRQLSDDWELDLATLPADRIRQFEIVDIRSPMEREGNPEWILKLRHVPANDFEGFLQLEITRDYLLVCAHGIRSRFVTSRLRASGRTRFYSLRQGIESLEPLLSPR
ncbi:MAG: HesA/MoeB/ThiF family protein [Verrucomicrobia bacterium]|nr:HesA/MoeB/ThiF family protein [Verrucomicrobiota bacterium]